MNSAPLLSLLLRGSCQLGRATSCRQCLLSRSRLLSQPSQASLSPFFTWSQRRAQAAEGEGSGGGGGGLLSKIKFDLGFIRGLKYPKSVLTLAGFRMHICCTEMIDHQQFFKEFDLPDTFNSWFLVTNLHVWLCMVRLAGLGKDGRVLRNCLVKAMWEDVEARSKQLGEAASLTARKEGIRQLVDVFHASLFAYDEGLLGDDKTLAGAVWRVFFEMRHDVDPAHLELVVAYVRKQVAHIDQQDEAAILGRGFVSFLPIRGDALDKEAAERQMLTVGRLRTRM
ncbi:ubiquinol-cytochrome-c reductase complex assembly factor 1-like [Babylonia areolata]|uniref:ubiquinol-cytochrome-c reductase complex assembly factor 1-like n=1 Tax=Babylonia areolata TaxID=304850 RepID=UPI003FD0A853